jgi:hypothetical protein
MEEQRCHAVIPQVVGAQIVGRIDCRTSFSMRFCLLESSRADRPGPAAVDRCRIARTSGEAHSCIPRSSTERTVDPPIDPQNGENEAKAAQTLPILRTIPWRSRLLGTASRRERSQHCAGYVDFEDDSGRRANEATVAPILSILRNRGIALRLGAGTGWFSLTADNFPRESRTEQGRTVPPSLPKDVDHSFLTGTTWPYIGGDEAGACMHRAWAVPDRSESGRTNRRWSG